MECRHAVKMLLGGVDLRTTGIDADGPRSLGCFYGGTIKSTTLQ
jgi:hypothetical protein